MLVVVDTNALLVSISDRSKSHWLFQSILKEKIQIAFTHDILTEYEELIAASWLPDVANYVSEVLTQLPTALLTTVHYHLHLITADVDDNKFVDCAFAVNADFIITNDNHFNILKTIDFPLIPVLGVDEFKKLLENLQIL